MNNKGKGGLKKCRKSSYFFSVSDACMHKQTHSAISVYDQNIIKKDKLVHIHTAGTMFLIEMYIIIPFYGKKRKNCKMKIFNV